MLHCAKCKESNDVDEFSHSRRNRSGRHSYCRACDAAYYAQTRGSQANARLSAGAVPTVGEANTTEADHLYLLRYPWGNSPIKVGHAKDVATRVRSLETGHNIKLRVLAIFPGQGRLEHRLHALLSDHRASDGRGQEWFNVTIQQALLAAGMAMTFARSDAVAD